MNFIRRRKRIIAAVILAVVVALSVSLTSVSAASRWDNWRNRRNEITYTVEITGIGNYEYSNVEVPESLVQVIEFQDGEDLILRKRPGRNSCTNMILTIDPSNTALFDVYYDDVYYGWFQNVKNGQYDRRSAQITLTNSDGQDIVKYMAMGTWPCVWRTVVQEDNNNKVVIEIELVVEELFLMPLTMPSLTTP